jgi:hypothetical protein
MNSEVAGGDGYTLYELVFGRDNDPLTDLDEDDPCPRSGEKRRRRDGLDPGRGGKRQKRDGPNSGSGGKPGKGK